MIMGVGCPAAAVGRGWVGVGVSGRLRGAAAAPAWRWAGRGWGGGVDRCGAKGPGLPGDDVGDSLGGGARPRVGIDLGKVQTNVTGKVDPRMEAAVRRPRGGAQGFGGAGAGGGKGRQTNLFNKLISDLTPEEIDRRVNEYPIQRTFTAIGGERGDAGDATAAYPTDMREAVASVLGERVPEDAVQSRPSRNGTYLSVKIGPVTVHSKDQLEAVFDALRADARTKWTM